MNRTLSICSIHLALLPCFGIGYLWWRSFSQTDDIFAYASGRMTRFRTSGGGFWFETHPWDDKTAKKTDWQVYPDRTSYPFAAGPESPWYERLGVLVNTTDYDLLVVAPYWLLLVLYLPIPFWIGKKISRPSF
jgi:hypothetical protein